MKSSKAHEFLQRTRKYARLIDMYRREIHTLQLKMTGVKIVETNEMKIPQKKLGTKALQEIYTPKILEYEKRIKRLKKELDKIKNESADLIEQLEDLQQVRILILYYIELCSFKEISKRLGATQSGIYKSHKRALKKLDTLV